MWPIPVGRVLYPVNPKAAERYRERKVPRGTKADRHDGWSLADALRTDALRTDGHGWRPLLAQDEATATLRALCRDEIALIEQRTALVNQLQVALREYYPVALELFEDWTQPFTWALVQQFPTPLTLQSAGKRKWENSSTPTACGAPTPPPARLEREQGRWGIETRHHYTLDVTQREDESWGSSPTRRRCWAYSGGCPTRSNKCGPKAGQNGRPRRRLGGGKSIQTVAGD